MQHRQKKIKFIQQRKWQYFTLGVFISIIGPIGEWLFLRIFSGYTDDFLLLTYIYIEIVAISTFGIFGYMVGNYADKLEKLALYDKLTGLYNRHYLMKQLREFVSLCNRYGEKTSLIMLDLDHFKKINDTYGHTVGDKTLKAVSDCVKEELRETDFGSRYGGEEFIIACQHTNLGDCYNFAERIRQVIENLKEDSLGFPGPLTISAGVYEISPDQDSSLTQIFNKLDKALYQAKQKGRNNVVIYESSASEN